jgi:hypothetical protein
MMWALQPTQGGALNDGRDSARFRRTNATCIWGVSDPLRASRSARLRLRRRLRYRRHRAPPELDSEVAD